MSSAITKFNIEMQSKMKDVEKRLKTFKNRYSQASQQR